MIGCIGYGFVGSALCKTFVNTTDIAVYDINDVSDKLLKNMTYFNSISKFVNNLERTEKLPIIFICVPTPMHLKEKKCDTRIIDSIIESLYNFVSKRTIVVIKSTIPIGHTSYYNQKYNTKIDIIFNPEFLTQNNAEHDFKTQNRTILGTYTSNLDCIINLYKSTIPEIDINICSPEEAEMCKLMLNSFWATKVAFANEIYDICTKAKINYHNVKTLAQGDTRLGQTHLSVPGFDGLRGFGGVCLPKDLNNLKSFANDLGLATTILDSVWEKNCEVREEFDWEKLIGKAISKN